MVRRVVAALALALLLGACGSADLRRGDVAGVVEGAFADAGREVTDVEVAAEPVDGRWPARATLGRREVEVEVDAGSGRVVRLDLGSGPSSLEQDDLEAIAAHEENPAAERARQRTVLVSVTLLAAAIASGLVLARRLRLREERLAAQPS